VKAAAVALNDTGMQALGYNYVNLDDCWVGTRDSRTNQLTWDASRFPSGIPALTVWLHRRGINFGLYTSAGSTTCAGKVGSRGHYGEDAQTFADWCSSLCGRRAKISTPLTGPFVPSGVSTTSSSTGAGT
jgi:alpha-galactosidase